MTTQAFQVIGLIVVFDILGNDVNIRAMRHTDDGRNQGGAFFEYSIMVVLMTRSSLGHTGRALKAGSVELMVFWSLQSAAILRIFPGLVWPQHYRVFVVASAIAFVVFVAGYFNILTRPRVDDPA